jgi:hypothetical protein
VFVDVQVSGQVEELVSGHKAEECWLITYLSKVSLKAVLLRNGNKEHVVPRPVLLT